jgi:hypothetical protein
MPLGGAGRRVAVREEPGGCRLRLGGHGLRLSAVLTAPPGAFVTWDYPNPSGPPRTVVNCSVADLTVSLDGPGRQVERLTAEASAVYEHGRETLPRR